VESRAGERPDVATPAGPESGASFRFVFEFAVALAIAATLFRGFVAEAYVVTSGSMAPVFFGYHKWIECPDCGHGFAVGAEEDCSCPVERRACPNCGRRDLDVEGKPVSTGDRVLILKAIFDHRPLRRWELAVFRGDEAPRQAFVKRIVGLPGESVQLRRGDIYIDGKIARKTWAELRSTRIPVYEEPSPANDDVARRVWNIEPAGAGSRDAQGWTKLAGKGAKATLRSFDGEGKPTELRDRLPYNPDGADWLFQPIDDFGIEGEFRIDGRASIILSPRRGPPLRLVLDKDDAALWRGDAKLANGTMQLPQSGFRLEFATWDRLVGVRVNGADLFPPVELPDEDAGETGSTTPVRFEVEGGECAWRGIRVCRDVYYTTKVGTNWPLAAVDEPVKLGPDEYFALGDNSAASRDARLWRRPGTPARALLGKPVLLHYPGKAIAIGDGGRTLQAPNFRRWGRIP